MRAARRANARFLLAHEFGTDRQEENGQTLILRKLLPAEAEEEIQETDEDWRSMGAFTV